MTIQEAEQKITGLTMKLDHASHFGFGGGSPAYLYCLEEEPVFALLPKLYSDTLLFIIAIHEKLITSNGLNPNSTINELMQIYPDLMVQQDLMNGWEFYLDETNNWDFVFITNKKTQIGKYAELEVPSKPYQFTIKSNWITIR